ncbi:hypothetical protein AVEN_132105-1 [Araneus ventricosus]|uniref:Tc1-like transposase DDE domain-containing protein n=1 Tax=Araneus ventricosus TaxID=182803 RepID=A0A4Y2KSI7_ARAVE|nr:hypothetical protein AVEN_132105-1 [Araneus ventricosus]
MCPDSASALILDVFSSGENQGPATSKPTVRERDRYGCGGLMVWEDIILNRRKDLHVFYKDSVTTVIYRDEFLEPYVSLFSDKIYPGLVFMDENARPHREHLVGEFLESENIWLMD